MAVKVTVRYFAAARSAAGFDDEIVGVAAGTTVDTLVHRLGERNRELAKVLSRCSYLCDGIAVRDLGMTLRDAQTIDVLPPFAGG
jgi:molybdopterin synthase sulfur carrier subunit